MGPGPEIKHDPQRDPMSSYENPVAALRQTGAAEAAPVDQFSFLDVLEILARGRRQIVWITVLSAVLGAGVACVVPKRYMSTVAILPPQQSSSFNLSSAIASQLGGQGGLAALAGSSLGVKNPADTYVALMKSRTVEDAMIRRFELMSRYRKRYMTDARTRFERTVNVAASAKDGLIRITVEDTDPEMAAAMANAYVEEYQKFSQHIAVTEAAQRRLFFEHQMEEAKSHLAAAEEQMKALQQSTGVLQLDSQAKVLIESAAKLQAQVAAQEVKIEGMRAYAAADNAQLVEAEQELSALRAQLSRISHQGDLDDRLALSGQSAPQSGIEYLRKLREVKYQEAIFEILARQLEAAKLDEAREGALVQVVDAAVPAERPAPPRRAFIALGVMVAGFLVSLVWVLLGHQLSGDRVLGQQWRQMRTVLLPGSSGESKGHAKA